MEKYYMAYGSNMSVPQMTFRCPDAKLVGTAVLQDYKLVFRVHATVEPEFGYTVPVLVWKISDADEARLDRYEGYPKYYTKKNMTVTVTHLRSKRQKELDCMVYIMQPGRPIVPPSMQYYNTILEGYRRFGFDKHVLFEAFTDAFIYEPTAST